MNTTTIKARSPIFNQPDEVQAAQNTFAVAVKHFREQPTKANEDAMNAAQQHLYQVQDRYHEGRKLRLEAERKLAPQWKR